MMLCLTLLDEGDFVFLVSDGVADNFDPVIRKLARHHIMGQQVRRPQRLRGAGDDAGAAATCEHACMPVPQGAGWSVVLGVRAMGWLPCDGALQPRARFQVHS